MKEYFWQFRIIDNSHLADRGVTYFAEKASDMAELFGYILIETKNVELDHWHNNVVMVSGIAVLFG